MDRPDIVYVVRPGDRNEELRYSLRSLSNLPHGRVWIAGYMPSWVTGAEHISSRPKPPGHQQTKSNLRAACEHPDVSDSFVYMNDDFFVMQPLDQLPVMHRGPITGMTSGATMASAYIRSMGRVAAMCVDHGIAEPLLYDLHAPMLVTKAGMLEALDLIASHPDVRSAPMLQERSLYGNLNRIGGEKRHNYKVRRQQGGWETWPFLSTNDGSFGSQPVGKHIRSRFPEQGPHEATPPLPQRARRVRPPRRPIRRRAAPFHEMQVPA